MCKLQEAINLLGNGLVSAQRVLYKIIGHLECLFQMLAVFLRFLSVALHYSICNVFVQPLVF
ncbi:hypothetical protein WM26_29550 [Burkholderia cepacia]|nr:hypothetical protein WM26_29550 [Burkholderia cepacia]